MEWEIEKYLNKNYPEIYKRYTSVEGNKIMQGRPLYLTLIHIAKPLIALKDCSTRPLFAPNYSDKDSFSEIRGENHFRVYSFIERILSDETSLIDFFCDKCFLAAEGMHGREKIIKKGQIVCVHYDIKALAMTSMCILSRRDADKLADKINNDEKLQALLESLSEQRYIKLSDKNFSK